jgi:hypothetical protein
MKILHHQQQQSIEKIGMIVQHPCRVGHSTATDFPVQPVEGGKQALEVYPGLRFEKRASLICLACGEILVDVSHMTTV